MRGWEGQEILCLKLRKSKSNICCKQNMTGQDRGECEGIFNISLPAWYLYIICPQQWYLWSLQSDASPDPATWIAILRGGQWRAVASYQENDCNFKCVSVWANTSNLDVIKNCTVSSVVSTWQGRHHHWVAGNPAIDSSDLEICPPRTWSVNYHCRYGLVIAR